MHRYANPMVPGGVETRLAAPSGRTRAASTRTATVRHQITPRHTPEIHRTHETAH